MFVGDSLGRSYSGSIWFSRKLRDIKKLICELCVMEKVTNCLAKIIVKPTVTPLVLLAYLAHG
jgi:hypothetical protein